MLDHQNKQLMKKQKHRVPTLYALRSEEQGYIRFCEHNSNSGGIIIGVHKQFQSRDITSFYFKEIDEMQIFPDVLMVQIINPLVNLILINTYFHRQSEYKKCRQYFWNKVMDIVNQLSLNQQLIICGDFNYENIGMKFMNDVCKDMTTFRREQKNRILSYITDHILILKEVKYSTCQIWIDTFDHSILSLEFQANSKLPEEDRGNEKLQYILIIGIFNRSQAFITNTKNIFGKKKSSARLEQELSQQNIKKALIILNRARVFQFIKKNFNPALITQRWRETQQLCTGKHIFLNCTQILDELSCIQQYSPKSIPNLPSLNQEETETMQEKMATDKAISFDAITHQFIKQCDWKILRDIWNQNTFIVNKKLGWVRLCPLNKCHPEIPNRNQFRPLVIMSPLLKFLELRFHNKLQDYLKNKILKPQTGFIS